MIKCLIPRNTQKLDFQQFWVCQDKLCPAEAWVLNASISKTDKLRTASSNYRVQVLAQAYIMVFSFATAFSPPFVNTVLEHIKAYRILLSFDFSVKKSQSFQTQQSKKTQHRHILAILGQTYKSWPCGNIQQESKTRKRKSGQNRTHANLALLSGFGCQATKCFAPLTYTAALWTAPLVVCSLSHCQPFRPPRTGLLPVQQACSSTRDAAACHSIFLSSILTEAASQCSCTP